MIRAAVLVALCVTCGCGRGTPLVILATTTSVANSGLFEQVLPEYPATVRMLQVGSGRGLKMLEEGAADVALSHAPEQETAMLARHPAWMYRKVLYNDFLIVGPDSDPAGIAGMTDAADAMKRIAERKQPFISRGDESGTHERERQLWTAAQLDLPAEHVIVAGAGMGQTLRIASATRAYTLTDRGTFETLRDSLTLRLLVEGDARLLNTYAVIADPANDRGVRFARWLADGEGRKLLGERLSSGRIRGFTLWPATVDGSRPENRPF